MNGMQWRFVGGAPMPVNAKAHLQHNNTFTLTGNIYVQISGSHAYHIRDKHSFLNQSPADSVEEFAGL
jgi:hypothetical protein